MSALKSRRLPLETLHLTTQDAARLHALAAYLGVSPAAIATAAIEILWLVTRPGPRIARVPSLPSDRPMARTIISILTNITKNTRTNSRA